MNIDRSAASTTAVIYSIKGGLEQQAANILNEQKAREEDVERVKAKVQQEISKCVTKLSFKNMEQKLTGFINIQDFIDFKNEVYPVFEEFKQRF